LYIAAAEDELLWSINRGYGKRQIGVPLIDTGRKDRYYKYAFEVALLIQLLAREVE
jgi:hypothetical protein